MYGAILHGFLSCTNTAGGLYIFETQIQILSHSYTYNNNNNNDDDDDDDDDNNNILFAIVQNRKQQQRKKNL